MPHILTSIIVPTTNVQCKIICKGVIGKKKKVLLIFVKLAENENQWVTMTNA